MPNKLRLWAGLILLTLGALAFRVPQLDRRPLHTDESVHAYKFGGLWDNGIYRYDPDEFHGPSLYYFTLPVAWFSSARRYAELTEFELRIVPVIFGAGLILLLGWVRDGLGTSGTLAAGALTAVSPAMVFYSRYYIHEMLLVFFTFLLLVGVWRYLQGGRLYWAGVAGLGLGLMYATKETFVFNLLSLGLAAGLSILWQRTVSRGSREGGGPIKLRGVAVLIGAAFVVSMTLFTSFFTNAEGPLDSLRTYLPWLHRAGGESPHVHPWSYYLELLSYVRRGRGPTWTELFVLLLGGVGWVSSLLRRYPRGANGPAIRFLGFYGLVLTGLYSAIPYKTPWCLLGFLHVWILLAGVGMGVILEWAKPWYWRLVAASVLLAGLVHLGVQAYRASFPYCDSQRNPYVYAHTLVNIVDLAERVEAIVRRGPDGLETRVQVVAARGDYWPLPWYLRRLDGVEWRSDVPEAVSAPVVILSPSLRSDVLKAVGEESRQMAGFYGLRPSVFLELYVEKGLWDRYLTTAGRSE